MSAELLGVKKVQRNLTEQTIRHTNAAGAALYQVASEIMAASVKVVPVDTGRLRSTAFVSSPQKNFLRGDFEVTAGYGTDYAVPVHEKLKPTEQGRDSGGRFTRLAGGKYLEEPFNRLAPKARNKFPGLVRRFARAGMRFGQKQFQERP